LTAAGTSGHGDELSAYGDLAELGAVVTKSIASFAWDGNPAPRVTNVGEHMLNAVGLSGPGVAAWLESDYPLLRARGATVVASIWGRTTEDYANVADALAESDVAAIEVNASCPNLEGRSTMFAHSATMTADLTRAAAVSGKPLWVKLSPNTPDLVDIAHAAIENGATAVVLVNTLLGLAIDIEKRRPTLGNGGGGVSGHGILPVSLRAVYDVRAAIPSVPIVGVGGISSGEDAVAMLMAGADAVEVGTASFADPRAPWRVQRELSTWCQRRGIGDLREIIGAAHG
jgi:dihydroorotate dehydrogenase (NAD+) catalytic subunit